ncbi:MAG: aminomethyl-transferring glycine dehydrogenase, partial [Acidimicrobiia bacterium]|nr:aminomethyl-transferring glycine dehydrogenase [Acidimicrobiia bacterium]
LRDAGLDVVNDSAFDTVTVRVADGHDVIQEAAVRRINLRLVDDETVSFTVDETTTEEIARNVLVAFGVIEPMPTDAPSLLPAERNDEILAHPVFHLYRSETEMLRYLRRLSDKDIALDRAMIPLGSCTMKLNAATEMEPITWPEFADIHPFAPWRQAQGYVELFEDLEAWLCEITGYDAVSLQPNAGSQGEYAGLLAIRGYHASRGEGHRDVCLIPASAHGTNPASAVMAGLRVVVVACDEQGNVDVADLQDRASEHSDNLAAIMVTYPSTHGVFEEAIREVCDIVHAHGGQVYLDGANLNAMLGVAKPGEFGADVSHLNLHKTFAIPHGGGGPGVGPIGVGAHLAPFLPGHPLEPEAGPGPAVSSAPWGSAGVLPISWAYIAMMGAEGLRASTDVAILSANYIATRLEPHFPVLYRGPAGYVAHECIIDIRPLHRDAEITVDDVAKRLIDYGFHAPTMSFPVAGTLMIEPTESESKEELDRFCDAMIAIRAEIARVESGEWTLEDSPVRNAPHTAEDLLAEDWNRPYSRELAAYPVRGLIDGKYWPPVSRVDNQYGDKNLMCACPPMEAYE